MSTNSSSILLNVEEPFFNFSDDEAGLLLLENFTNATTLPPVENATLPTDALVLQQTFFAYGIALLVTFLVFCWARLQFPWLYNLRKKNVKERKYKFFHQQPEEEDSTSDFKTHLANESYGFFSWAWNLFTINEKQIMDECGLDALCFIKICSMGYRFALCGILNALWLLPVYGTAEDPSVQDQVQDRIVEITTGNVETGDARLIVTALSTYVIFGHAMYVILQEFDWFIKMRHRFLTKPKARNYAVYVRNIPEGWRNNHGLKAFFERSIRGIHVREAHICLKTAVLRKKVVRRESILRLLEHAVASADESGIRPTHVPEKGFVSDVLDFVPVPVRRSSGLNAVDSILYHNESLQAMNKDITKHIQQLQGRANVTPTDSFNFDDEDDLSSVDEADIDHNRSLFSLLWGHADQVFTQTVHDQMMVAGEATEMIKGTAKAAKKLVLPGDDGQVLSSGFVLFSRLSTTQAALQMIHHEKPYSMEAVEAPDPDDIYWSNVGREHRDLKLGGLASFGLSAVVCLFWTVPVAFVSSLSNVTALRQELEFIDKLLTAAPWMGPVLEIFAPQLLILLNAMLPVILLWATSFEGSVSGSINQASLFLKLAAFTIIQTFFVTSFSGGVLQEMQRIIQQPTAFMDLLAKSLPAQSTFFIQMVFVSTATTFFTEGLGLYRIGLGILRTYYGPNLTARERKMTYQFLRPLAEPTEFEHPAHMSTLVLIFMVHLVYSVIAPLVCFVTAFCLILLQVLYRHQFVYIYPPRPDSGGRLWLNFISVLVNCMMIAELTVVGLLSIKKTWASSFLFPLLVVTLIFYIYIHEKHFAVASYLPTRICLSRDRRNRDMDFSFTEDAYLKPEMKEPNAIPNLSKNRLRELGLEETSDIPIEDNNAELSDVLDRGSTGDITMDPDTSSQTIFLPSNGTACRVRRLVLPSDVFLAEDRESEEEIEVEGDATV